MVDENGLVMGGAGTGEEPMEVAGRGELRRLSEKLSGQQQRALMLLSDGQPIRLAAEKLGVNRGTVYRWIKSDPQFRAAYNAWQLEQRESCRAGLLKCAEGAVAKIMRTVEVDGDLAFKVAKELGLFKRMAKLSTDPDLVEKEIEIEEKEEDARLKQRDMERLGLKPGFVPTRSILAKE